MHYFYILYEDHKLNKKKLMKNEINSKIALSNINIYREKFDLFLQEHKDNLFNQDLYLETPLHKIAKLNDKTFFVKIIQKLNFLGILNENLLLSKNKDNKACYDYIFIEIKNKYESLILKNEKEYNILKDFVLIIKNLYYSSIFETLPTESKMIINNFILKNSYDIIKKPKLNNLYSNIANILKNEKDLNIFEYIYNPFLSGINYLNILFHLCNLNEDFNKLLNLVNQIQTIKENKKISNCNNNIDIFDLISMGDLCILDHLSYLLRKINSSKGN